jgi:hypothetical protein
MSVDIHVNLKVQLLALFAISHCFRSGLNCQSGSWKNVHTYFLQTFILIVTIFLRFRARQRCQRHFVQVQKIEIQIVDIKMLYYLLIYPNLTSSILTCLAFTWGVNSVGFFK